MISLVKQYFFAVPFPINSDDSFCVDEAIITRKLKVLSKNKIMVKSWMWSMRDRYKLKMLGLRSKKERKNLRKALICWKLESQLEWPLLESWCAVNVQCS